MKQICILILIKVLTIIICDDRYILGYDTVDLSLYMKETSISMLDAVDNAVKDAKSQKNSEDEKLKNRSPLKIESSGIMNVKRGDTALIFYVTLINKERNVVQVTVESKECCQILSVNENDCESMQLIGTEIELYPMDTKNVTLLYPNLYLHDRKGSCTILLATQTVEISTVIKFDTMLNKGTLPLLKDYLSDKDVKKCLSVDENSINQCKPVICLLKYSGKRNFYNRTTRRCEKIPECKSEENDEGLPNVAYIPVSNTCRKLKGRLTEDDLNQFKIGNNKERLTGVHGYPLNVQCHYGDPNPTNGWCECHSGWSSAPFDYETFNPDIMVYHMCTIRIASDFILSEYFRNMNSKQFRINIIIISLLTLVLMIVLIIYGVIYFKKIKNKIHRKKYNKATN